MEYAIEISKTYILEAPTEDDAKCLALEQLMDDICENIEDTFQIIVTGHGE